MIEMKNAWIDFVHEIEDVITYSKYTVIPYPKEESYPKIQVSSATRTAAVFFNNKQDDIFAAYVLEEDNRNVIAAASKEVHIPSNFLLSVSVNVDSGTTPT